MQQRSIVRRPGWQAGVWRMLAKKLFLDSKFADVVIFEKPKILSVTSQTATVYYKLSGIWMVSSGRKPSSSTKWHDFKDFQKDFRRELRPQPKEEEASRLRPSCDGGGLKQTQRNKRVNKRAIYPSQKTDSQTNSLRRRRRNFSNTKVGR